MTILPKKKPAKDKAEAEVSDRPPLSPPGSSAGEPRGGSRRPSSPGGGPQPRWSSPPPVDHDRGLPGHEPSGRYEETAAPGNANKRRLRHRSPPHGASRKLRHDTSARGGVAGQMGAGLCPLPGCSSTSRTRQTAGATVAGVQDQRGAIGGTSHPPSIGQNLGNDEERSGCNSEDECTPRPCEQNVEEVIFQLHGMNILIYEHSGSPQNVGAQHNVIH